MKIQSLVVVALRLMALNFALRVALEFTPQMLEFLHVYQHPPSDDSRAMIILPWLVLIALTVSAVVLWVLALPIARFVTRDVPQDLSLGALSLADCYSIAFLGVGLLYIASYLPPVLNWMHYLYKLAAANSGSSWKEGVKGYDLARVLISFIIGVVLFVKGRKWAVALARKDAAGVTPAAPLNEKHDAAI